MIKLAICPDDYEFVIQIYDDAFAAGRREQARVDQEVVKGLWVRGRNDPIVGTELVVAQAKYGVLKALREAAPKED